MELMTNLYGVKATVLPASVLVLLAKYSKAIKETDGVVIQLSSLNVFKHVHNSYARSQSSLVKKHYKLLLKDVNRHIKDGNMTVCTDFLMSQQLEKSRSTSAFVM